MSDRAVTANEGAAESRRAGHAAAASSRDKPTNNSAGRFCRAALDQCPQLEESGSESGRRGLLPALAMPRPV
jgi:hypothetical protein